jgi:hypothetical protein
LTLYHHNGKRYASVLPNVQGRYPIPELHLELAILDGWVRFWYRRKLLPLPADMERELADVKQQLAREKRRADEQERRLDEQLRLAAHAEEKRKTAERKLAELRAKLERLRRQMKP